MKLLAANPQICHPPPKPRSRRAPKQISCLQLIGRRTLNARAAVIGRAAPPAGCARALSPLARLTRRARLRAPPCCPARTTHQSTTSDSVRDPQPTNSVSDTAAAAAIHQQMPPLQPLSVLKEIT